MSQDKVERQREREREIERERKKERESVNDCVKRHASFDKLF